jgi:hypothetical protein
LNGTNKFIQEWIARKMIRLSWFSTCPGIPYIKPLSQFFKSGYEMLANLTRNKIWGTYISQSVQSPCSGGPRYSDRLSHLSYWLSEYRNIAIL